MYILVFFIKFGKFPLFFFKYFLCFLFFLLSSETLVELRLCVLGYAFNALTGSLKLCISFYNLLAQNLKDSQGRD